MSVCVAARGAKQSGRTEHSASDDGRGRCICRHAVKSHETDHKNGYALGVSHVMRSAGLVTLKSNALQLSRLV